MRAPVAATPGHRTLLADLRLLCAGDPVALDAWMRAGGARVVPCLVLLVIGAAAYGSSIGLWRSPQQALYVAVKFPLLLLLTTGATALGGGMLALLLGAQLSLRQSLAMMLSSYALVAVILGSLAPVALFFLYNLPRTVDPGGIQPYHANLLCHVCLIGFAGVLANVRLLALLERFCDGRARARRVLFAWLAAHMFVGCQLSWNLRPFFGTPGLEVTFLRADAFQGSFYESVLVILTSWLSR